MERNGRVHMESGSVVFHCARRNPGRSRSTAIAAIKAENPSLGLQNQTMQLEGFAQPFVTLVAADQPGVAGKDKEAIQVLVVTPPNPQVVWGIRRAYTYSDQTRPLLDNSLAGLRKKYGPRSSRRSATCS